MVVPSKRWGPLHCAILPYGKSDSVFIANFTHLHESYTKFSKKPIEKKLTIAFKVKQCPLTSCKSLEHLLICYEKFETLSYNGYQAPKTIKSCRPDYFEHKIMSVRAYPILSYLFNNLYAAGAYLGFAKEGLEP